MQWELEYYDWLYFDGPDEEKPERPGPHPDPKHEWNTNPIGMLRIQDIYSD